MAHRHFGNIGDVWKHLALAEILAGERPQEYWESHAGMARNVGPATPEWVFGLGYFLRQAGAAPRLARSAYYRLLETLRSADGLQFGPGSPWLAMARLGQDLRRYLFCDVDAESLHNIIDAAHAAELPEAKVECVQDDGVSIVRGAGLLLPEHWASSTLVLIDPYAMAETSPVAGITPVDLACELTNRGIKTVLWYGFADSAQRQACCAALAASIDKYKLSPIRHGFWRGEIALRALDDPQFVPPGLGGCGLWCTNLSTAAQGSCAELGKALAGLYQTAPLPTGGLGALTFQVFPLTSA